MKEVSIIGVDLAKQVFQLHGATSEGEAVFRKKVTIRRRPQIRGELMRWMPPPDGIECAKVVLLEPR